MHMEVKETQKILLTHVGCSGAASVEASASGDTLQMPSSIIPSLEVSIL